MRWSTGFNEAIAPRRLRPDGAGGRARATSRLQPVIPRCAALTLILAAWILAGCGERATDPPHAQTAVNSKATAISDSLSQLPRAGSPRLDGIVPSFREIASESLVNFTRFDDQSGLHRMMEANGGGVALFDFDLDGRIDVFFTNGCRLPLSLNDTTHDLAIFRNLGNRQFAPVAEPCGLVLPHGYFTGCTTGDYNSDGFADLFVAAFGPDLFLRNNGDGTFSDVSRETGASSDLWGSSPAFADLNGDGNLDLIVINYVLATDGSQDLCPDPKSPDGYIQCGPAAFSGAPDVLFMNDGAGAFVDVTQAAGFTAPDGKGLGVLVFDMDHDGDPDIFVANDGTPNFLYRNLGRSPSGGDEFPVFEECAVALGCALTHDAKTLAGMGVASGDIDGDGWRDLLVTNFYASTSVLYHNLGGQGFADETSQRGLGPPTRDKTGFGTEFIDFDNDGNLDVAITNGHVDDFEWRQSPEPYRMHPQFFRNDGARFTDVSQQAGPFFASRWIGRGLAVADIDGDGFLDFVISHQRGPSVVLHNETRTENRSVIVKLIGTGPSNRSAFGGVAVAGGVSPTLVREVVGGGSFQSASDTRLHFGLGNRDRIPVLKITWPSGRIEQWSDIRAGEYLIVEGRSPVIVGVASR